MFRVSFGSRLSRLLCTGALIGALVNPLSVVSATGSEILLGSDTSSEVRDDRVDEDVSSEIQPIVQAEESAVDAEIVLFDNTDTTPLAEEVELDDLSALDEVNDVQPPSGVASGVIISELQTRSASGASSELIELFNAADTDIDVTGWRVQYASAAGVSFSNRSCIVSSDDKAGVRVVLPAKSYAVFVTTEFAAANEGFAHDGKLSGSMADAGGRIRVVDSFGSVVDLLGWGSASESEGAAAVAVPSSGPPRSLQRKVTDGNYQDTDNNAADFMLAPVKTTYQAGALYEAVDWCGNAPGIQLSVPDGLWRLKSGACVDRSSINFCEGVHISEIAANVPRQYIEIVNSSDEAVSLAECLIMTNRHQANHAMLPELVLEPQGHFVVYIDETTLKLTKSTSGTVYLLASDGETEVESVYYEDLSADTSWSKFEDGWRQTYILTPGQKNEYAQYAACQVGYVRNLDTGRCNKVVEPAGLTDCGEGRERNPATGRCRNIPTASELAPCREGQYRSEETNRCRSIASVVSSLKACAEDQFRNPLTNRCKKIASADDVALADCGEGRERNPATNRCRNVLSATMPKVGFAPEKITQTAQGTLGWWALGGVSLVALGYAGWQWRFEVSRFIRRIGQAFSSGGKP